MLQSFSCFLDSWLFDWSCRLSCCIMAKQWGLLYAYNASWIQNDEEFMNANERIHSYWFAELICFVCWLGLCCRIFWHSSRAREKTKLVLWSKWHDCHQVRGFLYCFNWITPAVVQSGTLICFSLSCAYIESNFLLSGWVKGLCKLLGYQPCCWNWMQQVRL